MAKDKTEGGLMETVKTVFWALVIAGVFRTLFFQPFWIPSGSMKDTLLIGDFLFVNKMAYGYSRVPARSRCARSRAASSVRTRARRCGGVPPPDQGRRFHQARDRPAGRHRADEGRRAVPERQSAPGTRRIFIEVMEPQGPMQQRRAASTARSATAAMCQKRSVETCRTASAMTC
jgi:signal peptidase I